VAKSSTAKKKTETLPTWDLSALYSGLKDPAIARDIAKLKKDAAAFAKNYQGKIAKLTGDQLAGAVATYEKLSDGLGKLGSYAQLVYAADMSDPAITKFYQDTSEALTAITSLTVFFTLELNKVSDANYKKALKSSKKLTHYQPWLDSVRVYKPFQLSDELEQYIHELSVVDASWQRLYDESITRLRFNIGGKTLTEPQALDLLSNKDPKKRKEAAKEIGRVFAENAPHYALITNTLAKAKQIEDDKRGFKLPISSRNVSNQVEDEVVDALIATVKKNYKDLSHKYYAWKAKKFGNKSLDYWDRNAPLSKAENKVIPWESAKNLVLEAYEEFSPEMRKIGEIFFKKNWIDAKVRAGKDSGAFSHSCVPSVHPYILMNYQGKTRDVMTLAHELGHGVHQYLARAQGALMAGTPLTLAETASVFGEKLTFQKILKNEKNSEKKK
jgi:oligoendopeptidase F